MLFNKFDQKILFRHSKGADNFWSWWVWISRQIESYLLKVGLWIKNLTILKISYKFS